MKKLKDRRLVYRALTGINRETGLAIAARRRPGGNGADCQNRRSSRHGSAEIPAACRTAAHRCGCDASTARPACILWRAPPRSPIAPIARRCRGCGNGWRREHPRSARARRPASSVPAARRAAGSRLPRRRHPARPQAGYWDRDRPRRTPGDRTAAAAARSVPARCRAGCSTHSMPAMAGRCRGGHGGRLQRQWRSSELPSNSMRRLQAESCFALPDPAPQRGVGPSR